MYVRFGAILLVLWSSSVLADASSGDFMGYRLGGKYPGKAETGQQVTTTGNLLVVADRPVKPGDIAQVQLLVTPETRTIGSITASQWFATETEAREFARKYFRLLRAKYPGWAYGWEVMDARMNIVEVSFRQAPHDLWLRLARDQRDGKEAWRFSMALGWSQDSAQAAGWRRLSADEQVRVRNEADQRALKESDVSGL